MANQTTFITVLLQHRRHVPRCVNPALSRRLDAIILDLEDGARGLRRWWLKIEKRCAERNVPAFYGSEVGQ